MGMKIAWWAALLVGLWADVSAWTLEQGLLTSVWTKELVTTGTGVWDWEVHRDPETGDVCGEPPCARAIDTHGRIVVCDTYNNRLLVFSSDGERQEIIRLDRWVGSPNEMEVDIENNIYVSGATPDYRGDAQVLLTRSSHDWRISLVDPAAYRLAAKARLRESFDRRISPLGCRGSKIIPIEAEGKCNYQILDEHGNPAGFAPSIYKDKKGRFYDVTYDDILHVYSKEGSLTYEGSPLRLGISLIRYRCWVYVYTNSRLYRFSEDGTIEEEIRPQSGYLPDSIMASPFSEHLYSYTIDERGKYSLIVTKWKYGRVENTTKKEEKKP